jgi:hypothetical protein
MELQYIKVYRDTSATIDLLSDNEAGRLFKALLHLLNDKMDNLPGQEKLVFAMLKAQIDRDNADYQAFLDKQRSNGRKGGRPSKNPLVFEKTQKTQEKEIEERKKEKENDNDTRAREDMPFGLTDEDIQASLYRRQQLEDAARSIGLQVTEAGMMYGERLVQEYGLEKVLDAIKKAVDVPKWAYVEGICKGKGVKPNDNHGDHGTDSAGARRGKYSFLFDGNQAV